MMSSYVGSTAGSYYDRLTRQRLASRYHTAATLQQTGAEQTIEIASKSKQKKKLYIVVRSK